MQGGFVFVPTNERHRGSWFDQWGTWCPPKSNVSFIERKMGIYGHLCITLSILQKEQVGCFVILYYVSNIDQVSRLRNTSLVWVEQQHRTLSTVKKDRIMSTALITRCCGTHTVYFYRLEKGKFGCKSNRPTKRSGQTDFKCIGWTVSK